MVSQFSEASQVSHETCLAPMKIGRCILRDDRKSRGRRRAPRVAAAESTWPNQSCRDVFMMVELVVQMRLGVSSGNRRKREAWLDAVGVEGEER